MKTKEETTNEFMADLRALLSKYGAEIEADDHFQGYAECGQKILMTVTIPGIHEGPEEREFVQINLGRWFKP